MECIYIYGLYSTINNIIRYVGKTIDLEKRLNEHIHYANNNRYNNYHKNNWILKQIKNGHHIQYKILETINDGNWVEKEIFWINQFKNLVNKHEGGKGGGKKQNFLPYGKAKIWIKENLPQITSSKKWRNNIHLIPNFIPHQPYIRYKNNGWCDWYDFLGKKKRVVTINYVDLKKMVNDLNISTHPEYKEFAKKNYNIPLHPWLFYKNDWVDFNTFLSEAKSKIDINSKIKSKFLSFEDIKKQVNDLNIKSGRQYGKWWEINKPDKFPRHLYKFYEKSGWVGADDFFNKKIKPR